MQVVQWDDVQEKAWPAPRGGEMRSRVLLQGDDNSADNFTVHIHHSIKDFYSPRHRHNFEQVRLQLQGAETYKDKKGDVGPGVVGYFPAGTYYGPYSDSGDTMFWCVQFGPDYISQDKLKEMRERLDKKGEFNNGIYTWFDEEGRKHNKDGWQALWEEHFQRKMDYPAARYESPIFMKSGNYDWRAVPGAAGVEERFLGDFSHHQTAIYYLRLAPGAEYAIHGGLVAFFLSGTGRVAESADWKERTSLRLEAGETARLKATEQTELFVVTTRREPNAAAGESTGQRAA